MSPDMSRRGALLAGGAALVPLVAGCGGAPGSPTPTPDPDYGRDSYGVLVENHAESAVEATVRVTRPFEELTFLDETLDLASGDSREWNGVITEPKEHAVTATINGGDTLPESSNTWVTPGSEDLPPDPNVWVDVRTVEFQSGKKPLVSVGFKSEEE